jgi:O6-methylguanine-DNA--protein-cysteine methyltransferase
MGISVCEIRKVLFPTPLGWAGAAASGQGICRTVLPKKSKRAAQRELDDLESGMANTDASCSAASSILRKAVKLLQRYFSGDRVSFDVPLDIRYYTPFQQAVWRATSEIPYAETRSYAWIAKRSGRPLAARAAGQAVGANPLPVIIP